MDTVFIIRLRSYGFLHPGREQLRVVLKRSWPFIPGSTVYGLIAAALIRLDGGGTALPGAGTGGYHHLLSLVAAHQIRFTPLLPTADTVDLHSAAAYCQHAAALATGQRPTDGEAYYQSTPHAPLARDTLKIHGDQLYAFTNHRAGQSYQGFIFAPASWEGQLKRALRLTPFLPLGGKGKFALAEGKVIDQQPVTQFQADFETALADNQSVRLLTPMILQTGQPNWLLEESRAMLEMPRLRRYRQWRTGPYYDFTRAEFVEFGLGPGEGEDAAQYRMGKGAVSQAATGVPEQSRFVFDIDPELPGRVAEHFIQGVGHPNWTYLGWGQVVAEWI